jgi:hypothetical protein
MEIPVAHPEFQIRRLAIETAGWIRGPRLLVNGAPVKRAKGRYTVTSDAGTEVAIELKHNFLDPVPKVKIGDNLVELARALKWYEYVWLGIPIVLLFTGGGLGALVGILAVYASARVFRADLNVFAKYGITALISLGAFVAFAVLATVFKMLIGSHQT